MKYRIISALVAALIPTICFAADNLQVTQGSGTTVAADEVTRNSISEKQQVIKIGLGAEGQHDGLLDAGQQDKSLSVPAVLPQNQSPIPVAGQRIASDTAETSSTSTVINATAHVAAVDDVIQFVGGTAANLGRQRVVASVATNTITVSPAFTTAPANGDTFLILRPATPLMGNVNNSTTLGAGLIVNPDFRFQDNTANGLLKREDDAHVSLDAGVQCLSVRNEGLSTPASSGDYQYLASGTFGNSLSSIVYDPNIAVANQVVKQEDSGHASGDPGLPLFGVTNTASFFNRSGSQGDYVPPQIDADGRVAVNAFGAAVGDFVQGCNVAITTATTGDMIVADTDERFYITSWNCTNTGATATRVILEDDDGTDFANVMLPATTGFAATTFPTPLRMGAINKGVQVNVITAGSSTICCANGFKAAN